MITEEQKKLVPTFKNWDTPNLFDYLYHIQKQKLTNINEYLIALVKSELKTR